MTPVTVTMPVAQFLVYRQIVDAVKAHILEEHTEEARNSYGSDGLSRYRCSVCGISWDRSEKLSSRRHWTAPGESCWVSDILELIEQTEADT